MYGKQRVRDVVLGVWVQKGWTGFKASLVAVFRPTAGLLTACQTHTHPRTHPMHRKPVCVHVRVRGEVEGQTDAVHTEMLTQTHMHGSLKDIQQ